MPRRRFDQSARLNLVKAMTTCAPSIPRWESQGGLRIAKVSAVNLVRPIFKRSPLFSLPCTSFTILTVSIKFVKRHEVGEGSAAEC